MTNQEAYLYLENWVDKLNRLSKTHKIDSLIVEEVLSILQGIFYASSQGGGGGTISGGSTIYSGTASGINTYTANTDPTSTAYEETVYKITFTNTNTGASTLGLDGLTSKPIKKRDTDGTLIEVSAGDVSGIITMVYDSTKSSFVIVNTAMQLGLLSQELIAAGIGNVGGVEDNDTFAVNTPLETILFAILRNQVPPTYTAPIASLAKNQSRYKEIGSTVSVQLTGTFTQNDGGSVLTYQLKKDAVNLSASNPYTDNHLVVEGDTDYDATYTYDDGPIKNDNLGDPYPVGQILAGSVNTDTETITGIFPYFYGTSSTPPSTSGDIYGGTKVVAVGSGTLTIPWSGGTNYLWFAIHEDYATKTAWQDPNVSINNGNIGGSGTNLFNDSITIAVTSTGLTSNYTENYKVYISDYQTTPTTLEIS